MGFWSRLLGRETRSAENLIYTDPFVRALMRQDTISRTDAMNIPAFAACVKFISETVAALPVKLYTDSGDTVTEIPSDPRAALLNEDTGDTLTGYQFKQALTEDLLIDGGGYAYIHRKRNDIASLHYIPRQHIGFLPGTDPIFKSCFITVNGAPYGEYDFIKATRKSKDGVRGIGILEENQLPLAVNYNMVKFANIIAKTGGNKKGFLQSDQQMTTEAMDELRANWRRLYGADSTESMILLNKGLTFQESSATSVEMQLEQLMKANAAEIGKLFTLPAALLDGNCTEEELDISIRLAVSPVLIAIESALNRELLLETEKEEFFFAFDTKELLKGSIDKRFAAYKAGVESNVLQIDEARYMENLPPIGFNLLRLSLRDVLYNPDTDMIYVPNTGDKTLLSSPPDSQTNTQASAGVEIDPLNDN